MFAYSKNVVISFTFALMFFVIVMLNIGYTFTLVSLSFAIVFAILNTFMYMILNGIFLSLGGSTQSSNKIFIGIFAVVFAHYLFLPRELLALIGAFILFICLKNINSDKLIFPITGGILATFIGAIFSSYSTTINNYPVVNDALDNPSVIHIAFDAYASKRGLPAYFVDIESIDNINQNLLAAGFDVYTNSASTHSDTKESLTELFNKDFDWSAGTELVKRPGEVNKYDLLQGDILEDIIKDREIVTWSTYLDIYKAIPQNGKTVYRNSIRSNDLPKNLGDLSYFDQSRLLVSRMTHWFLGVQEVQLFRFFHKHLYLKDALEAMDLPTSRLQPIRAAELLDDMIEDVIPKMGRGQYLFSHVILPHFPYVLNADCKVKDVDRWSSDVGPLEELASNGDEIVKRTFADYLDQLKCADKMQHRIISAVNKNPSLRDAIIIFHADHGSKILTEAMVPILPSIEANGINPNDVINAAFLAVRLNAETGELIDEPVVVQDAVKNLLNSQL